METVLPAILVMDRMSLVGELIRYCCSRLGHRSICRRVEPQIEHVELAKFDQPSRASSRDRQLATKITIPLDWCKLDEVSSTLRVEPQVGATGGTGDMLQMSTCKPQLSCMSAVARFQSSTSTSSSLDSSAGEARNLLPSRHRFQASISGCNGEILRLDSRGRAADRVPRSPVPPPPFQPARHSPSKTLQPRVRSAGTFESCSNSTLHILAPQSIFPPMGSPSCHSHVPKPNLLALPTCL